MLEFRSSPISVTRPRRRLRPHIIEINFRRDLSERKSQDLIPLNNETKIFSKSIGFHKAMNTTLPDSKFGKAIRNESQLPRLSRKEKRKARMTLYNGAKAIMNLDCIAPTWTTPTEPIVFEAEEQTFSTQHSYLFVEKSRINLNTIEYKNTDVWTVLPSMSRNKRIMTSTPQYSSNSGESVEFSNEPQTAVLTAKMLASVLELKNKEIETLRSSLDRALHEIDTLSKRVEQLCKHASVYTAEEQCNVVSRELQCNKRVIAPISTPEKSEIVEKLVKPLKVDKKAVSKKTVKVVEKSIAIPVVSNNRKTTKQVVVKSKVVTEKAVVGSETKIHFTPLAQVKRKGRLNRKDLDDWYRYDAKQEAINVSSFLKPVRKDLSFSQAIRTKDLPKQVITVHSVEEQKITVPKGVNKNIYVYTYKKFGKEKADNNVAKTFLAIFKAKFYNLQSKWKKAFPTMQNPFLVGYQLHAERLKSTDIGSILGQMSIWEQKAKLFANANKTRQWF